MVDASVDHVGAALQQRSGPEAAWQPLGFFSKKLDSTQRRYSAYNRELLACVMGIRHFRFMMEGHKFTLYTNHKPLTHALGKAVEPWTTRQSRHLSYVAEFTNDIRGEERITGPASHHQRQACEGKMTTCEIRPLSELKGLEGAVWYISMIDIGSSSTQHDVARPKPTPLPPLPFGAFVLFSYVLAL